jgi:MFS transporter, ACDE family, multidrug resistance protein
MNSGRRTAVSPFRQLRGAWAVTVACVLSFIGTGPIDPILPVLSHRHRHPPASSR